MANNLHGIVNRAYEDDEDDEISICSLRNDSTTTYCEDKRETVLDEYVVHDMPFKFYGPVYKSVKKKSSKKWRVKCFHREPEMMPASIAGLHTRKYTLVNPGKLTSGAVKLWVDLPDEIKFDSALAGFRQFYESENGKLDDINRSTKIQTSNGNIVSISSTVDSSTQQTSDDASAAEIEEKIEDKTLDTGTSVKMKSKIGNFIKMCLLFSCWLFFTVVFIMYDEMEVIVRSSSIGPGELKGHLLKDIECGMNFVLTLSGPFLTESGEKGINVSSVQENKFLKVWIDYLDENDAESTDVLEHSKVPSEPWRIILQNEDLDFREGEARTAIFRLSPQDTVSNKSNAVILHIQTTSNQSVPFTMSYHLSQIDDNAGVLYAFLLICGLYTLVISEVINRTMAAMLTSTASLAALALAGNRPSLVEVVTWLDQETLLLLFSMMLLVSILAETRIFDFLAVFAFEVTKGKIWPLITLLCAITATLSTVLDNVTTVLLMTPVTIRLCEVMDMDPIPVLVSMILYSNIGGAVTPVGDPPNVIIASNRAVIQAGINFINFTLHMALGVILIAIQTYLQLRFIYRDTNKLRINEPRNIQDLRHQISIWTRAAASLPHMSQDEQIVLETLEKKIQKLTDQLKSMIKESHKRGCPQDTFQTKLIEMKTKFKIYDKKLLVKATVAVGFVVIVFLFHFLPELNRLSLGWTAFLGALLLLVLANREDLEPILHRVEWSTLLFFAALFVLMEALSRLGLIDFIGGITENLILTVDEGARLAVSILLMLWVSGLTSAFVDNIPLTTMMVRVVASLGSNNAVNLPMTPLIWALSFGACLGGNGTLIGASSNVVCAGVAEQHGYKLTFKQFFKIGFPVMIGHLIVASGYLLICHCVFEWHQ